MAVFRIEKNTGYTVMSNHHLRNKNLTLKAKGLLSQMLSLPEDWDYTLKGLALINKEKIDAIREAVRELEREGYMVRSRVRDEKGRLRGTEYVIYEYPQEHGPHDPEPEEPEDDPEPEDFEYDDSEPEDRMPETPTLENPTLDSPMLEKPMLDNPTLGNPTQLNKDILSIDPPKKDILIPSPPTPSSEAVGTTEGQGGGQEKKTGESFFGNPEGPEGGCGSHSAEPSGLGENLKASSVDATAGSESPNVPCDLPVDALDYMASEPTKGLEGSSLGAQADFDSCRKAVLAKIDYDRLVDTRSADRENIDEIIDLILGILCTTNRTIRIGGTDYPAEVVKNKFSNLRREHILSALDSVKENATQIRSMRQYMKTVLFNAPSTWQTPPVAGSASQDLPIKDDRERLKRLLERQRLRRQHEEEAAKAFDAAYGIKKGPTAWGRTLS